MNTESTVSTHLCAAIFAREFEQAWRDPAADAIKQGATIIELRIDENNAPPSPLIRLMSRLPIILTCRAEDEGGRSKLSDVERYGLMRSAGLDYAYNDFEWRAASRLGVSYFPSPWIASFHDFSGRPARLTNVVQEIFDSDAAVAKIVWMARSIRDNLEAFEILQHRRKPTIALCMGEAGIISRILAKKFGAFLTFASLSADSGTAPGQITLHDFKHLYRWDSIKPSTKVYGVVAQPVAHSMSPAIHNAAFDAVGHDGVYLPLLVEAGYESFKAFMESFIDFPGLDLSGLSITIPHKENALRYLREKNAEVEDLAARIGAVNTIVIERPAGAIKLRGCNTDYAAILDSITAKLNITRDGLAGMRVAVIGAGGTGRTAVAALASCGATVVVYNRTRARADALAAEFNGSPPGAGKIGQVVAADLDKLCATCCQAIINTTSVGMHPNISVSPMDDHLSALKSGPLVFDTVYNPMKTRLLMQAEATGCQTIGGVEMFVRQAAAQFEAWTGRPAPRDIMRQVVEARLTGAQ